MTGTGTLVLSGIVIESRASDHFINATQLCKAGGKKFAQWMLLESTKEVIRALEQDLLVNSNVGNPTLELVDRRVGGNHSGSWIHPDLAVQLAQWISPFFAIQVSRWIRELFATGSVKLESTKTDEEVKRLEQRNFQLEEELKRHDALRSYTKSIEEELVIHKKRMTRDQTIYIASTEAYARQGIFKVGRTRQDMKARLAGHNVSHVAGDKVVALAEFKVFNATQVEKHIHSKLSALVVEGEREFFRCPYITLVSLVELMVRNDDTENIMADRAVDTLLSLRKTPSPDAWTLGLDMSVHWPSEAPEMIAAGDSSPEDNSKVSMRLTMTQPPLQNDADNAGESQLTQPDDIEVAKFDVTNTSVQDRKAFVEACVLAYRKIILKQKETVGRQNKFQLAWVDFQPYLKKWLGVGDKDKRFKALHWKDLAEEVVNQNYYDIEFYRTKPRQSRK